MEGGAFLLHHCQLGAHFRVDAANGRSDQQIDVAPPHMIQCPLFHPQGDGSFPCLGERVSHLGFSGKSVVVP
ncbi:hypothetical protein MRX96_010257 [Rhipicephalus microplus]